MDININDYKVSLSLRIDWSEMDLFGHVNNVMFVKYVQASRVNYWEQVGLTDSFEKDKIGPILASTACQFKKPLYYPGNITIKAKIDHMGTTSFSISHIILNDKQEICATAQDVVVMFNFNTHEKLEIPGWVREKVLSGKF